MTGQGYGWVLVGVRGCVAVDAGHGLVTLLSLSMSIKDQSLHNTTTQMILRDTPRRSLRRAPIFARHGKCHGLPKRAFFIYHGGHFCPPW